MLLISSSIGDFLQLPPVPNSHAGSGSNVHGASASRPASSGGGSVQSDVKFCFESSVWNEAIFACIELQRVFRQQDMEFVKMLNELRVGLVTPATIRAIEASGSEVEGLKRSLGVQPSRLFAVNHDVDRINTSELSRCPGEQVV